MQNSSRELLLAAWRVASDDALLPLQNGSREEFVVGVLIEPAALDVEKFETGDADGERERVEGELRKRAIHTGARLVVEDVHGTIADL